jgi:undecaprenyl diphosphate synthase
MSWKEKIKPGCVPVHVAIIMDGNGRWAKQRGFMRVIGHENGVSTVRKVTEACADIGVKYLTLYAFSTENWNRPRWEVDALMDLLVKSLKAELDTLNKNQIRLTAIGDLKSLGEKNYKELMNAIEATSQNTRMTLVLALSYSSRWEIADAAKKLAILVQDGKLDPNTITPELLADHMTTAGLPDPELLIRTSGEFRVSNFLLWQIAYAELFFSQKLWPDFQEEDLFEAIVNFQNRERRFGLTSEQIKAE